MFGRGSLMGGFFENMFSQIEAERMAHTKKELGITTNPDGLEGCERLGIPYKYDTIEIASSKQFDETDKALGEYFYCYSDRKQLITIYKNDGKFLFECNKVHYYKQGMFLVGKKKDVVIVGKENPDDFGFALYYDGEKLTEPIFRTRNMEYFNKYGFARVGLHGKFDDVIIDKSGNILVKGDSLGYLGIHGVVASSKDNYINLLTGAVICKKGYNHSVSTKELLFVQVDSNCVYQINTTNGDFVVHGEVPKEEPKREPIKYIEKPKEKIKIPNRNDKCPCGSGKKYKNCCINLQK